jgi:hypothetical protein
MKRSLSTIRSTLAGAARALTFLGCGFDDGGSSLAGHDCTTNADCGAGGHCLGLADGPKGVRTIPSSAPCAAHGSRGKCPARSRCWMTNGGDADGLDHLLGRRLDVLVVWERVPRDLRRRRAVRRLRQQRRYVLVDAPMTGAKWGSRSSVL